MTQPSSALSPSMRAPLSGLLALSMVFAMLAIGHTTVVLQRDLLIPHTLAHSLFSLILGAVGIVLIWIGLKQPAQRATLLGYVGGSALWVGWFEWTWEYFGHWLKLEPVMDGDMPILAPGLLMIQSTSLIVIALLIYLGANKDTQCRMFNWFHRNLRLKPGKRSRGYQRQVSRIVAIEAVFVIWFIYLCAIAINDPRLIRYDSTAAIVITVGFLVWGIYLITKLLRINGLGAALRYAIPTGGITWLPIEGFSRWGLYPEIWVKPAQYPLLMGLIAFVLVAVAFMTWRSQSPTASTPTATAA